MLMEAFEWDEFFTTGLDRVDAQHRHLVALINRLGHGLIESGGASEEQMQALYTSLTAYALEHFAEEERLMDETGVAMEHQELHRRQHRTFAEQVASIWGTRGLLKNPAEALHGYLVGWLSFHILRDDQVMARQVALIRAGETPARSYERATQSQTRDKSTHALVGALNNLYGVLSDQNRELVNANALLEERVAERTAALQDANRRLEQASRTDGLLQIANRMHFNERLEHEWGRARREAQPVALLMADVDHFKRYNDSHGHQAGDRCLRAVAAIVTATLRRPADLAARYGGEELAVLLPNTDAAGAYRVAVRIGQALERAEIPHGASPVAAQVTLSIGAAARIPAAGEGHEALVAAADAALYQAKDEGRNRVCLAD